MHEAGTASLGDALGDAGEEHGNKVRRVTNAGETRGIREPTEPVFFIAVVNDVSLAFLRRDIPSVEISDASARFGESEGDTRGNETRGGGGERERTTP